MKRKFILSSIISILCILCLSLPAAAFTDMGGHWSSPYVTAASNCGLLHGYPNGSFKPDNNITRAEFVTILALESGEDLKTEEQNPGFSFPDTCDHWAEVYINWASAKGVVSGYEDGRFLPERPITRQEIVSVMCRYVQNVRQCEFVNAATDKTFNDEDAIQGWAKDSVHIMVRSGIINGRGNNIFAPADNTTRGETATIICNYLNYYPRNQNDYGTGDTADIYLNGNPVAKDVACPTLDGSKMLPVRTLMEALGYNVKYYSTSNMVLLWREYIDIELWLGKNQRYANGIKGTFKTAPVFIEGTSFAPGGEILHCAGFIPEITTTDNGTKTVFNIKESNDYLLKATPEFFGSAEGTDPAGNIRFTLGSTVIYGTIEKRMTVYAAYLHNDGGFFAGRQRGSIPQGTGRMISPSGEFFAGSFNAGIANSGTMYFADGSSFTGTWDKGSSSSAVYPVKGTYTAKDGTVYGSESSEWRGGALTVK